MTTTATFTLENVWGKTAQASASVSP